MQFRKVFLKIVVFIIIFSMASSCSSSVGGIKSTKPGSTGKVEKTDSGKKELSIAYYEHSERMVKAAINEYILKNPNVEFKEEIFERKEDNYQETLKETNSLLTRALAGEGPDIIVELSYFRLAKNYKTLSSGLYCDLNELIKNDEEFKLDDYYKSVLDTGVINGKRYIIPLAFGVNGFLTTKETLTENMIEIRESNWNWDFLIKTAKDFIQRNEGKDKYLLSPMFIYNVLQYYIASQVDYTDSKSHFNSEEFKTIIKDLKEINSAIYPVDKDNGWTYSPHTYIKDEKTVLSFGEDSDISNIFQLSGIYDNFKKELNQELVILPFPHIDANNGYPFSILITVGITSTCKYKKEAFEYIKTMLLPEINGNITYNLGLPVSKAGFKKVTEEEFPVQYGGGYPHPEEVLLEIDKMVNNLGSGVFYDEQINSIAYKHFLSYQDGRETLEETVKKIDDDVYFYLNE